MTPEECDFLEGYERCIEREVEQRKRVEAEQLDLDFLIADTKSVAYELTKKCTDNTKRYCRLPNGSLYLITRLGIFKQEYEELEKEP